MAILQEKSGERCICGNPECTNAPTWLDFIEESEEYFMIKPKDLEALTEDELIEYIAALQKLWAKEKEEFLNVQ